MPDQKPSILIGALAFSIILIGTTLAFPEGGNLSGAICCLIAIIAPMVAIWHYTTTHNLTIPVGKGAGMGAIVTTVGMIINVIVGFGLQAAGITPDTAEAIAAARDKAIDDAIARGSSAKEAEQAIEAMSFMFNPSIAIVMGIVGALIVGAIGGAIAAAIFKKGSDAERFDDYGDAEPAV